MKLNDKITSELYQILESKGLKDIDISALWDNSLTKQENFSLIVGENAVNIKHNQAEEEALKQKMLEKEELIAKQKLGKALAEIKKSPESKADEYFSSLKEMIRCVIKGKSNGLVVIGEGGIGKSHQIIKTLENEGTEYEYINTYLTPLELYNMIYANRKKIIVIDDTEGILDDPKNIGILKSALWSITKERIVSYFTTSPKLEAPKQFEFEGKILLALNEIPKNRLVQSLVSRVLNFEITLDYETKLKCIYEIAKSQGIPLEICDFIKNNTDKSTTNFNFRTLNQIFYMYQYHQQYNGHDPNMWKKMGKDLLKSDEDLAIILELDKSGKSVEEQFKVFFEQTGLSKATFKRYRRKLGLSRPYNKLA